MVSQQFPDKSFSSYISSLVKNFKRLINAMGSFSRVDLDSSKETLSSHVFNLGLHRCKRVWIVVSGITPSPSLSENALCGLRSNLIENEIASSGEDTLSCHMS